MSDISVQFHASPSENLEFIEVVLREFRLYLVAIQLRPFAVKEIDAANLHDFVGGEPNFRRFAFLLNPPVISVQHELDFADKNPDYLRFDIGVETEKGLQQSWLSARTQNRDAIEVWKKVALLLKQRTMQGAIAVNPKTGARSNIKSFRYTAKARALSEQGMPMLPMAGASLLKFPKN
jgi:hypothetical protein